MGGGGGGCPAKMRKILQNLGSCPTKANSQVGKSGCGLWRMCVKELPISKF